MKEGVIFYVNKEVEKNQGYSNRFIKGVKMMIREIAKYTIGLLVAFGMLLITGYGV